MLNINHNNETPVEDESVRLRYIDAIELFSPPKKLLKDIQKTKSRELAELRKEQYKLQEECERGAIPRENEIVYLIYDGVYFQPRIDKLEAEIKLLSMNTQKLSTGKVDVQRAKSVPLDTLISFNQRGYAKCLWHEEKNPSLYWYKETNTFHSFCCGRHGDSIELAKKLYTCDFLEAVKRLNGGV